MTKLLLTTALCCAASGAAAELTYGAAFAKYHNLDGGGDDLDAHTLGAAAEYRFGAFLFSGEIGRIDLGGEDLDLASVGFGYEMPNGVMLGLDYTEFDVLGDDAGVASAYAAYTFGEYTLGLSVGDSSDLSETTYSIFGAWDVTPGGTVGLDAVRIEGETLLAGYADYELDRYDVQADLVSTEGLDVFAVAGGYDLGNRFSLIGSLGYLDLDGTQAKALTVGGQYEITPGANVELAVGRIDVDDGDNIDLVTFGVGFETGRRTSKRRTLGNIFTSATGSVIGLTNF